jgi:hypothetical protein
VEETCLALPPCPNRFLIHKAGEHATLIAIPQRCSSDPPRRVEPRRRCQLRDDQLSLGQRRPDRLLRRQRGCALCSGAVALTAMRGPTHERTIAYANPPASSALLHWRQIVATRRSDGAIGFVDDHGQILTTRPLAGTISPTSEPASERRLGEQSAYSYGVSRVTRARSSISTRNRAKKSRRPRITTGIGANRGLATGISWSATTMVIVPAHSGCQVNPAPVLTLTDSHSSRSMPRTSAHSSGNDVASAPLSTKPARGYCASRVG